MKSMGDEYWMMRMIDVDNLMKLSEDLVSCLNKDINDAVLLEQNIAQSNVHVSQSHAHFTHDLVLLQGYQEKIVLSKQKTEETKSEVAASPELEFLQKELEEELQKECLIRDELSTVIADEISALDHQRLTIERRRQIVKKQKQDRLDAEMKLAMYASVTKIIPKLDGDSKISGCILEKEKEALEYFEYDPSTDNSFDMCNSIWEKITP